MKFNIGDRIFYQRPNLNIYGRVIKPLNGGYIIETDDEFRAWVEEDLLYSDPAYIRDDKIDQIID